MCIRDRSKTQLEQLYRNVERQGLTKANIGPSRLSVRDNKARTNNTVESFYVALRGRVKVSHPNLYTFLGHLQYTVTRPRMPHLSCRHYCGFAPVLTKLMRVMALHFCDNHFIYTLRPYNILGARHLFSLCLYSKCLKQTSFLTV